MKNIHTAYLFTFVFLGLIFSACQEHVAETVETTEEVAEAPAEKTVENDTDFSGTPVTIGLMAADQEASINFYENILGLTPSGGFDLDGDFGVRSGLTDNQPISVKTFTFGKGPGASTIKIVASPPVKAHSNSAFIHDDNSVQYLTVPVKNLEAIIARLRANNIEFKGQTPINIGSEEKPRMFVLVQDPDGTFVELIQD